MNTIFKKATLALIIGGLPLTTLAAETTGAIVAQASSAAAPQAIAANAMLTTQEDVIDSAIVEASRPQPEDPGTDLLEQIEDWKNGSGGTLARRAENGEVFMAEGVATVKVTPESRDWASHRLMAYKDALMSAQAQYIEWEGISARAQTVSRFFKDLTKMPSFEPQELQNTSKLAEVLDKAVALAGGMLDEKLRELDINPEEFKAAAPEKRARIFENSISEQIAINARATLTGLVPVKTFEANDAQGQHAIAVIVVASDKMRQFIHDMKNSRGDLAQRPEKASKQSLRELFANDKTALIHEFGIRKMYDEQGFPVLISFGQAGTDYNGSDLSQKMDARKGAFLYAKADAYANFAYLLNSTGNASLKTSIKSARQTDGIARAEADGVIESEEARLELVKSINNEIAARGHIDNLSGTRQLLRWTVKHPQYGNEINGVVYIWHPKSEQHARAMTNFTPKRQDENAKAAPDRPQGQTKLVQSRDLMSADDF